MKMEGCAPLKRIDELAEEWPDEPFEFAAPSCALLSWWQAHFPAIPARLVLVEDPPL